MSAAPPLEDPADSAERGDVVEPLRFDAAAPAIDLHVDVRKRGPAERSFSVLVQTPLLPAFRDGVEATWDLDEVTASELVREHMNDFSEAGQSPANRSALLSGAGMELFSATPEIFREAYWGLARAGVDVRSVLVTSAERSIPWELLVPNDGVDAVGGPTPLGVRHSVARWFQTSMAPPQRTRFTDARVIAPQHGGIQPLPKAGAESELVCTNFAGSVLTPALVDDIDTKLQTWDGTLLHFVCHGDTPTGTGQVLLLDGSEKLRSAAVKALPGLRAALRTGRALVFLNACKVGGLSPTLVGSGGFAYEFVVRGARAVIAPLWAVDDVIAFEFASAFYKRVIAEPRTPFADIVRDLRARAYAPGGGDDTWAAYCYYGDPFLAAE